MPNLCSFDACCGCAACYATCSYAAITMRPDDEGFLHPRIDETKCVGCKLCEKACPVLHCSESRQSRAVYAARANADELRMQSSSGGAFSLLARQIIAEGGIVYGAAIRKDDLMVYHRSAASEDELALLRGSKYVQSEMGCVYRDVKAQLLSGRHVLFSGTPCQIAGLRTFLGREYDNLLSVEVICHAAPSPLVWQKYLEARAVEIRGRGSAPAEVFDYRRISFRRKNCGWKRFALSLGYASDKAYVGFVKEDPFLNGFLKELYNRPSCHDCSFKSGRSGSDITLGDYWGVMAKFPDMDDDKGVSILIANSDRGVAMIDGLIKSKSVFCRPMAYADAVASTGALVGCPAAHRNRKKFFSMLQTKPVIPLIRRLTRPPMKARINRYLRDHAKIILKKAGLR